MMDAGMEALEYTPTMTEKDYLRGEIERVKTAALLGYGALLAHNTDGRYDLVLAAMRDPLFPGDKQPG